MNTNYEDRIGYRRGNVIGLNFASPKYEDTDFQRRSEGCDRNESCQVISLDDYRVEKTSNNIYVKGLSLEEALQQTPLEQRRSRKGKNAQKLIRGLTQKISKQSNSNVFNLLIRRDREVREAELLKELNEARSLGMFDGFLHKRDVISYLDSQLPSQFGYDLNPLSYLQKKELMYLGYNPEHYYSGSLESRIEGGMN